MALVELRGVSKSFSKGEETITPLDNISMDIEEGEFISLMGPSGNNYCRWDRCDQVVSHAAC
jgi:putative ABC transport system ATP-binding protein